MQTKLLYLRGHSLHRELDAGAVASLLTEKVEPFWLDCEGPGEETAAWLKQQFDFHPLALDDLTQPNYRPRLSEYEEHLFMVVHSVANVEGHLETQEVHCFLTRDGLVTVHDEPCAITEALWQALVEDRTLLKRGPDYVLYMVLDLVAESCLTVVDSFDETIDLLEIEVMSREAQSVLDKVFALRHDLATMRRLVSSLRDALNNLVAHQNGYIRPANAIYIRDVYGLMVTVHEIVESQRDLVGGVLEVYLSSVSNRLNNIMRQLTIVSTIFLPMSFIAGIFGTNFTFMPFNDPLWFGIFVISLAIVPAVMLAWFRRGGLL